MIVMRLGIQKDLHVLDVEAELVDALHDQRRRARIAAIDEDVTLRTGDQESGDVVGADVIEVAGNAERRDRFLPADLTALPPFRVKNSRKEGEDGQDSAKPISLL